MDINECGKPLKTLERVKGIEPSYSAWKAAALPLSYTRARGINYHAATSASTAMRRVGPAGLVPRDAHRLCRACPLTSAESLPILMFPSTQRKEVIQCLLPSAVTSLGSPARLFSGLASGRSQPWTSELRKLGRGGSNPAASFSFCDSPMCNFARLHSDARSSMVRSFSVRNPGR
jgi:hypothetical protein